MIKARTEIRVPKSPSLPHKCPIKFKEGVFRTLSSVGWKAAAICSQSSDLEVTSPAHTVNCSLPLNTSPSHPVSSDWPQVIAECRCEVEVLIQGLIQQTTVYVLMLKESILSYLGSLGLNSLGLVFLSFRQEATIILYIHILRAFQCPDCYI